MAELLTLEASDIHDADHWYWRLHDAAGKFLGDHEVRLDRTAPLYPAYVDLCEYLDRNASPDRRREDETRILDELGAWMGEVVLGPLGEKILAAGPPLVVRVVVRVVVRDDSDDVSLDQREAVRQGILFRPLELAHVRGKPLALQDVSLVFEPPQPISAPPEPISPLPIGERLRMLAVFSLPLDVGSLNLRQERYELKRLVESIARSRGLAVDLRVLQYGVTRDALREILEEGPGWDVLHFSGHGLAAALVLEEPDGTPDPVPSDELVGLLRPARGRLKWVTLSACLSAAATAEETLRWLGIEPVRLPNDQPDGQSDRGEGPDRDEEPESDDVPTRRRLPALAQALVGALDCAVLAMRYPVGDRFVIDLARELYEGMLDKQQSLPRALQLALPKTAGCLDRGYPPLSVATPALFGRRAVDLRLEAPRIPEPDFHVPPTGLAYFPPQPPRLVGRVRVMVRSNAALARRTEYTGVLLHGMAGAGKTSCALELAYQHEGVGRFTAFVWYRGPEQGKDIDRALLDFALAMEQQLPGLSMVHLVDNPSEFEAFLPRLTKLLGDNSVLIVLDNLETLLRSDGRWRDPKWGALVDALLAHQGESRVVLTSRIVPQIGAEVADRLLRLPIHALSLGESVVLARQLPHLGRLLEGQSADDGTQREEHRRLVSRVLEVVQGHPKLIELAEGQAADPELLASHLDRATEAWAAGGARLGAFFDTGESELADVDFLQALAGWTRSVAATLPPDAQTLFRFLCCLEEEDRHAEIVAANWGDFWQRSHRDAVLPEGEGANVPDWEPLVERLADVGLVDVAGGKQYVIHPGVAEAARADAADIQPAVDDQLGVYWFGSFQLGMKTETSGGGPLVTLAGRRAAAYLIRRQRWDEASTLLEQVIHRDKSPATVAAVLPLLRRIADATKGAEKGFEDAGVLATALREGGRWQEAEAIERDRLAKSLQSGAYRTAAAAASTIINIMRTTGRAEEALDVVEQMKDATRRAGLGPWTQLVVETQRLQLLADLGRYEEVLAEVEKLRGRMQGLPDVGDEEETANPWNVREVILDTGHTAAIRLGRWERALALVAEIGASKEARGAPPLEVAQARFNDYGPLLRLGRYDEARALLLACREVYEAEGAVPQLGRVFSALADLEGELGHRDQAIAFEETALRYKYLSGNAEDCAVSHFNLANYLIRSGGPTDSALAHRLASALIWFQTASGQFKMSLDALSWHLALFTDTRPPIPADFAELCRIVEQIDGVRFADLFERLPTTRAATGDEALAQVLKLAKGQP